MLDNVLGSKYSPQKTEFSFSTLQAVGDKRSGSRNSAKSSMQPGASFFSLLSLFSQQNPSCTSRSFWAKWKNEYSKWSNVVSSCALDCDETLSPLQHLFQLCISTFLDALAELVLTPSYVRKFCWYTETYFQPYCRLRYRTTLFKGGKGKRERGDAREPKD